MAAFQAILEPKQHATGGAETQETAVSNDMEPKQEQQEANGAEAMQVDEAAAHATVVFDLVSSSASDAEPVVSSGASDEEESAAANKQEHANGGDVVDSSDAVELDGSGKRGCAFCSAKKVATGCIAKACKKCCVSRNEGCAAHARKRETKPRVALEQKPAEPLKVKKPVLKREFKETNFMYYEETVAIFCVRDFFASKKMSQGILNDQVRSLRVNGSYAGKQLAKKARVHDPEIKAKIKSVLSKGAPYSPRQA
uniref:Uncharacterized protein n=1 Tax=Globisporangium ultimum (strain ATCC 200006 / CBS 805.95 / DAOM BR144) TaxID=431595 RepID=K3WV45_GLOUD